MFKKLISISLVAMMLSVTVFATPYLETLDTSLVANANSVFKYAESTVNSVTEGTTVHSKDLTAWGGAEDVAESMTPNSNGYYEISTGAELAWFATFVNSDAAVGDGYSYQSNAILMNDIDLAKENWYDFRIKDFAGIFDGNNHTIYNLKAEGGQYAALFQAVKGGTVKDLNITGAEIISTHNPDEVTTASYTAVVCGYMENGTISNVSTSGTIKTASGKYANGTGSIVGRTIAKGAITISGCISDVTIDLSNGGTTENTFSNANSQNYGVGGIVGVVGHNSGNTSLITVEECGFEGSIEAPRTRRVAGIVGNIKSTDNFTITKCYNTGQITALGQVAGIAGWVGSSGTFQKVDKIVSAYNTGNIIAKSATNSHASGIANGAYAKSMENVYSIGDVYVEVDGVKSFNDKCALLYTHLGKTPGNDRYKIGTSAFCNEYTYVNSDGDTVAKHSHAGLYTQHTTPAEKDTCSNETGLTKAKFADGTALNTLGTTNYAKLAGLNNGYPVFTWQTSAPLTNANTYYVATDDSLALALDNAGYVSLDITPLGDSATVTVGTDVKTITAAGTYTFAADANATATVSVTGQALITIDLMNQRAGSALTALEATAIKAEIADTESRTIVLALFNGDALEKVVYTANATFANGAVSAVIDLSSETVTDKTLKAFVWENGTLAPIAEDPYTLSQQ